MKMFKYIGTIFIFGLLLIPFASSIQFNDSFLLGERFECAVRNDDYTGLANQGLSFYVTKIVKEDTISAASEPIEGYTNGEAPTQWHGSKSLFSFRTNYEVFAQDGHQNLKVNFPPLDNDLVYATAVPNSNQSLRFVHYSYDNYKGESKPCEAWYQMNPMTIGEVSFDTMVHLNVTNSRFYFALDSVDNNSKMVYGFFDLYYGPGGVRTNVSVYEKGSVTGSLSTTPRVVYTSGPNSFHWFKVKIFVDTWNDLYNITIQQYGADWNFVDTAVSTVIYGSPHSGENRTSGVRLSGSHILDKIQFKLVSNADEMQISEAYVDNFQFKYYNFPAVYADVKYTNQTYAMESPEPKKWMNNTIITSYNPPAYPVSVSKEFGPDYWAAKSNPELLTGWELAPTWMYMLPYFIPTDSGSRAKVIASLLSYFNNGTILEERALLKPNLYSDYKISGIGPFNNMSWTLMESKSTDTVFYFNSTNIYEQRNGKSFQLKVEYASDVGTRGWLKSIKMFQNDERDRGIIDFITYYSESVPGFNTFVTIATVVVVCLFIMNKIKRNTLLH